MKKSEVLLSFFWVLLALGFALAFLAAAGCRPPEPTWGRFRPDSSGPFAVAWDHEDWDGHNQAIREALGMFPCGMFYEARAGEPIDVTIGLLRAPLEGGEHLAGAWKTGPNSARILVAEEPYSIALTYVVIAHELGHVAGLRHDREYFQSEAFVSIMTPHVQWYVDDRPGAGKLLPHLTSKDMAALEERYCGGTRTLKDLGAQTAQAYDSNMLPIPASPVARRMYDPLIMPLLGAYGATVQSLSQGVACWYRTGCRVWHLSTTALDKLLTFDVENHDFRNFAVPAHTIVLEVPVGVLVGIEDLSYTTIMVTDRSRVSSSDALEQVPATSVDVYNGLFICAFSTLAGT